VLVWTFHMTMAIRDDDKSRKSRKAQRVSAKVRAVRGDLILMVYDDEIRKRATPGAARKRTGKKFGLSDGAVKSALKRARARRKARQSAP